MDCRTPMLNAVYDLLQNYPLKKITVDMVLQQSGVSRSTFYRNFTDKYDLMNQYYATFFDEVISGDKDKSWEEATFDIMNFIYTNRQYYAHAFMTEGQNSCSDFFYNASVNYVTERYCDACKISELSPEEHMAVHFYSAGSLQTTKLWIKGEFSISPQEMTRTLCTIMPQLLRENLE